MSTTHFAKFAEARADLSKILDNIQKEYSGHEDSIPKEIAEFAALTLAIHDVIPMAQRFYVPEGANIIEGHRKDIPFIQLPYPCIAVLDEVGLYDDIKDLSTLTDTTWKISIGFTNKIIDTKMFRDIWFGDNEFGVLSLVKDKVTSSWVPSAGLVICSQVGNEIEVKSANLLASKMIYRPTPDDPYKVEREFFQDISSIANLCTMLSLHNVKPRTMLPPEKLQKKRIRHGGKPLMSYKVLVVDGEEWHDTGRHGTVGGSVRSHMRRGHIRQLHASERRVWVRSTLVHGKTPGFVSKDYRIKI